jgi:hypothetical protein
MNLNQMRYLKSHYCGITQTKSKEAEENEEENNIQQ